MWRAVAQLALLAQWALLALLAPTASAQSCSRWTPPVELSLATTSGTRSSQPLGPRACHHFTLNMANQANMAQCNGTDTHLVLEFYRLASRDGRLVLDSTTTVANYNVFFIAAKGQAAPAVSMVGSAVNFDPNAKPSGSGNDGTFVDSAADKYQRPYHRLFIPNPTQSSFGPPVWHVTVANLNDGRNPATVAGYEIRAACAPKAEIGCPRPLPEQGPCSSGVGGQQRGSCVDAAPGQPAGVSGKVCSCQPGWGDYGCNTALTTIPTSVQRQGEFRDDNVVVRMGEWKYYQVTVPLDGRSQRKLLAQPQRRLLVELTRRNARGGKPLLAVKPVDAEDRGLPFYRDNQWYDVQGRNLELNVHFSMHTLNGTTPAAFYIAVLNTDDLALSADLRVRWTTAPDVYFCPQDCMRGSGFGECVDPVANAALPRPLADGFPSFANPSATGFLCRCSSGRTGLYCEGQRFNLQIGGQQSYDKSKMLGPGEWHYHFVDIPTQHFKFGADTLLLGWIAQDTGSTCPRDLSNAMLTFDEGQFPQQADRAQTNRYQQGQMIRYSELDPDVRSNMCGNNPNRLQVRDGLVPNVQYVLGIHNSDWDRASPFRYNVGFAVPGGSETTLHPYMGVIIGVVAAIVLCLIMTLFRRFFLRHGVFGGLRRRLGVPEYSPQRDSQEEGQAVQLGAYGRRRRGVRPSVVASFPTYTFAPPPEGDAARGGAGHKAAGLCAQRQQPSVDRRAQQAAAAQASTEAGYGYMLSPRPPPPVASIPTTPRSVHAAVPDAGQAPRAPCPEVAHEGSEGSSRPDKGAAAPAAGAGGAFGAGRPPGVFPAGPAPQGSGAGGEGGSSGEQEELLCTVCLCEYEEGEMLRRLPCGHEFHCMCIDKWMTQHDTCPICRVALDPNAEAAEASASAAGAEGAGGSGGGGGEGAGGRERGGPPASRVNRRQPSVVEALIERLWPTVGGPGGGRVGGPPGEQGLGSVAVDGGQRHASPRAIWPTTGGGGEDAEREELERRVDEQRRHRRRQRRARERAAAAQRERERADAEERAWAEGRALTPPSPAAASLRPASPPRPVEPAAGGSAQAAASAADAHAEAERAEPPPPRAPHLALPVVPATQPLPDTRGSLSPSTPSSSRDGVPPVQ